MLSFPWKARHRILKRILKSLGLRLIESKRAKQIQIRPYVYTKSINTLYQLSIKIVTPKKMGVSQKQDYNNVSVKIYVVYNTKLNNSKF